MPSIITSTSRPVRAAASAALAAALVSGVSACQDEQTGTTASSSTSSSTAQSASSQAPTASDSAAGASSGTPSASGTDATATGEQSKVTFTLPEGFKVFDRHELTNDASLAELSGITGVPASQLRAPTDALDLNAVSLKKENGGTNNILLFSSPSETSIPDEAAAKSIIAQTGSSWVGYRTVKTSLGQAALAESTDPAQNGGKLTHIDIYVKSGGTGQAQVTITAASAESAKKIADLVTSTIKAA